MSADKKDSETDLPLRAIAIIDGDAVLQGEVVTHLPTEPIDRLRVVYLRAVSPVSTSHVLEVMRALGVSPLISGELIDDRSEMRIRDVDLCIPPLFVELEPNPFRANVTIIEKKAACPVCRTELRSHRFCAEHGNVRCRTCFKLYAPIGNQLVCHGCRCKQLGTIDGRAPDAIEYGEDGTFALVPIRHVPFLEFKHQEKDRLTPTFLPDDPWDGRWQFMGFHQKD